MNQPPLNMEVPVNQAVRLLGETPLKYTVLILFKDGKQFTFQAAHLPTVKHNESTRQCELVGGSDYNKGVICRWDDVAILNHELNPGQEE